MGIFSHTWRQLNPTVKYCQIQKVEKQYYGPLVAMSIHQIAVGHTFRTVDVPHVPVVPFHRAVAVITKFAPAGGRSMLSCKLLTCPSNLMRSNLPWSSPLRTPFSTSVVSTQSHKAGLFCLAVLSHMNLFYIRPSHQKVSGMKRNCT